MWPGSLETIFVLIFILFNLLNFCRLHQNPYRNCMGETSSTAILTVEDIQDKLNDEERQIYSQRLNQPPKFKQGLKSQEAKINEDFRFFIEGMKLCNE